MRATASDVGAEFDRLATVADDAWDTGRAYHELVLRALPRDAGSVLDVGCGAGVLTRRIAARAQRVVALDLSAALLARARAGARDLPIEWRREDFLSAELEPGSFDAVVSLAALHHLPMEAALARMAECLRPGGALLVLDVYEDRSLAGRARSLCALPVSAALRWRNTGRPRAHAHVRAAWAEHARGDRLLAPRAARERATAALPGARVHTLLLWRYLIEWRKPA